MSDTSLLASESISLSVGVLPRPEIGFESGPLVFLFCVLALVSLSAPADQLYIHFSLFFLPLLPSLTPVLLLLLVHLDNFFFPLC